MNSEEALEGLIAGYSKGELQKVAAGWNPLNWPLAPKLPGGKALQNPLVALLAGGGMGGLLQLLLSGGKLNMNTLIAALLGGTTLGGLSYGARQSLGETSEDKPTDDTPVKKETKQETKEDKAEDDETEVGIDETSYENVAKENLEQQMMDTVNSQTDFAKRQEIYDNIKNSKNPMTRMEYEKMRQSDPEVDYVLKNIEQEEGKDVFPTYNPEEDTYSPSEETKKEQIRTQAKSDASTGIGDADKALELLKQMQGGQPKSAPPSQPKPQTQTKPEITKKQFSALGYIMNQLTRESGNEN